MAKTGKSKPKTPAPPPASTKPKTGKSSAPPAVPYVVTPGAVPPGVTRQRPAAAPAATPAASALPPRQVTPAPKVYTPVVDPSRARAGDKTKSGLAGTALPSWMTTGLQRGLKDDLGLKPGEELQWGDLFPNVQEALRPVFMPEQTAKEQGPQTPSLTRLRETEEKWRELGKKDVSAESLGQALGLGLEQAGNLFAGWQEGIRSVGGPTVGGAIAGAPQAVMNLLSAGGQMTEQAIGTVGQAAGVAINPAQVIVGGQTIPTLAKLGAALAVAVGTNELAAELNKHTNAPPGIVASLVANVVARQRAAGQDSAAAEGILNTLMGATAAASGHESTMGPEALIQLQAEALKDSDPTTDAGDAWKASMFLYEGEEYVQEARQRLAAGESWDVIYDDIQRKITPEARVNDFVGQMVLDPFNALEAVGGVPKALGMGSRSERNAANALREFVMQTDEGAGLLRLAEVGGDVSHVGAVERVARKMPGLGELIRPLPETIVTRRSEEAAGLIKMIAQGISPDAPGRLLAAGIDQHPVALAMEAFVKHNADDLIRTADGTAMSSKQVQELLGLGGRTLTDAEAAALRAPAGSVADMFRSNAADRARDWLAKASDDAEKLANEFTDMQRYYTETMASESATMVAKGGAEVTVTGHEAIKLAEDRLITWLEHVNATYMKAAGIPEATGLYKGLLGVRKVFGKVQAPFRFFHMNTNLGMSIRNLSTNKMLGWMDNFNMLTPIRSTQQEIARLGLSGAYLGRQLGAQTDIVKGLRASEPGLLGTLKKYSPMELSQWAEDVSGQQIALQAFQRQFSESWRVGKSIPEKEFAEVAHYFPGREAELKALIENADGPGDLQKVLARVSDDSWRGAASSTLNGTHDAALLKDLDEIVSNAPDQETAAELIEGYVQSQRDWWSDFVDRGYVMNGTPASDALNAAEMATRGLPPKRRGQFLDDFTKQLVRQDATVYLERSYAKQALNQLSGIDPALVRQAGFNPGQYVDANGKAVQFQDYASWLNRRMGDVEEQANTIMANYRPAQYEVFDAIKARDWERVKQIGADWAAKQGTVTNVRGPGFVTEGVAVDMPNPFAGVVDQNTAWDSYFAWSDDFWSEYRKTKIEGMRGIGKEAAEAVGKVTGTTPPTAPAELIEKFLPLTTPEQRRYFAQVQAIARSRGIDNTVALRDILKKYGVPHANRVFRADIADRNWYDQAVAAILRYSSEEGAAAKAAGEAVDDADGLAVLMEKFNLDDIDGQALNQAEGMAAQMSERDAQIQKVLDAVRNTPPAAAVDQKAIDKLKDFIRSIEPRHVTTRAVSEQVAGKARDFALLNYGDKRGIDLVAGMMYNYPKWYMGTMKNMVSRALENPGRLAAIIKLRQQIRTINRDLPEWWQDQISLQTPAGVMYMNILATIDPLNGFLGDKFRDPDLNKDPLSAFFSEAQQFGPGLHGTWASLMALRATVQGDREASMGWMGSLGPATKGITAITALAKEYVPGMGGLPSGGIVVEPWLWGGGDTPGSPAQMIGTKYDARRIGLSLAEMVDTGQITPEEGYDAMLAQSGPIFDRALQMSKVKTSGQVLASWLFGAGVKQRPEIEIEVQRMDADRIALMKARDDGYYNGRPEAWRAAWEEMRSTYPWMDFVQGFRRDETGRANIYSMSVYDRMPPNNRAYIEALMGGKAEIYNDLMDKFYGGEPGQGPCSIENMTKPEQEMFMAMMKMMGATLSLPSDATGNEWNMARQARAAMYEGLNRQYANIAMVQDRYYDILNGGGENAAADARAYLDKHGELQAYWDDKDAAIAKDPILKKYWGSMELFERVSQDEFERQAELRHPGVHKQIDEYYRLRDLDPLRAKEYLKTHAAVTAYWSERTEWTLGLDEELVGMAGGITNLQGQWGRLRQDTQPEMPGQQRVIDLIESGSRPMGDFELPEDMNARQVQAGIKAELDKYQGNWGALYRQLKGMGNLDDTLVAFQEFASGKAGVSTVMSNLSEAKALLVALATINEGTISSGTDGGAGGGTGAKGTSVGGRAAEVDNAIKYLAAISVDGDYMNDWLTHTSSGIAQAMKQFGQMVVGNRAAIEAANRYLQAVAGDGDYMNDWLTHVPPEMRSSLQKLGQLIAESKGSRQARRLVSRNYGGASNAPKPTRQQQAVDDSQMDAFMASMQQSAPRYAGMMRNLAEMDQAGVAAFLDANPDFRDWLASTGITLAALVGYFKRLASARAAVSPGVGKKKGAASLGRVISSQPRL